MKSSSPLFARVLRVFIDLPLFLALTAAGQSTVSFFQTPSYPGGGAVAVADFNGDGKMDIATGSGVLLLGNGDGTFRKGTNFTLPAEATVMGVGDFNGDGKTDIVAFQQTEVSILLGNGDGTFQPPINTSVGFSTGLFAVGKLGNGTTDVVLPYQGGGGVEVLIGNGDGSFKTPAVYQTGTSVNSVVLADVNGDGLLDVAAAGQPVTVLLGNGDGTFKTAVNTAMTDSVVAVADFNNDGKLDLAGIRGGQAVDVSFGNGNGTFQAPTTIQLNASYTAAFIAAGDFASSGAADIVVYDGSQYLQVLKNDGHGAFSIGNLYFHNGSGCCTLSISVADLNGDQKLDLVLGSTNEALVLLGNGNSTLQGLQLFGNGNFMEGMAAADFNKDGKPDIAAVQSPGAFPSLEIFLGNGDGTLAPPTVYPLPGEVCIAGCQLLLGDFNGDGNLDVFVPGSNEGVFGSAVLLGNGNGTFQSAISGGNVGLFQATADLRGNGKWDLVWLDGSGNAVVQLSNGDGTFGSGVAYFIGPSTMNLAVGDVNGDGKPDLVASSTSTGLIGILLGKGDGTFSPVYYVTVGGPTDNLGSLVIGDFNGDGIADLAVRDANTVGPEILDSADVLLGTGGGKFAAPIINKLPYNTYDPLRAADFNGDGKLDLAFPPILYLTLGNGDGTFGGLQPFPGQQYAFAIADFDGDGRPDIASAGFYIAIALNTTPLPTPDFQIAPESGSQSSQSINAGQSAMFNLAVTPMFGFSGTVNLSCAISPSLTPAPSCTLPSSVNVTAGKSAAVQVTVGTVAAVTTGTLSYPSLPPGAMPFAWSVMLLVPGLALLRNRRLRALAASSAVLSMILLVGCGGYSSPPSHTMPGTPPGTYTVTVNATSGSLQHSTTLTVVVQ